MVEITALSRIKLDKDGEPYIEFNKRLVEQLEWSNRALLEWEIVGNMAVIRKKENAGSTT
jgi:hypothetical protein